MILNIELPFQKTNQQTNKGVLTITWKHIVNCLDNKDKPILNEIYRQCCDFDAGKNYAFN